MQGDFHVTIKRKKWLDNPPKRWNNGLLYAGNAWRAENQDYPPQAGGSTYRRTGALGNKSSFEIVSEGREMHLKAVSYWPYPMYGVGVFGPKATPIVPVTKKILAWPGPQGVIFARKSRGYIWAGKLEKIKEALKKAFKLGIQKYTE